MRLLRWRPRRVLAPLACLGLWLALGGCAAAPPALEPQGVTVFPAGRAPALAPLPVQPANGAAPAITTCEQLLAFLRSGADPGERLESPAFNAYVDCLASAVIDAARPAPGPSRFDPGQAGRQIFDNLDLAHVASSLAPRRPAEHYRLRDFSFRSTRIEPLSVELLSEGFRYRVDVLAAGDFRRRGDAGLLVRLSEKALAGSYDRSTLWVLEWAPGGDRIDAFDALDLLRPPLATRR